MKSGYSKFVDIKLDTLGLDEEKVIKEISDQTVAIFITHCQGYNALTNNLLNTLKKKDHLIEDVCESHGATHDLKKLELLV